MHLAPCPATPNCVSTAATDLRHAIAPIVLLRAGAWPLVRAAVLALPHTRLVRDEEGALHAECRVLLLPFLDDLVVQLQPDGRTLAVRSASRLGYYDFGVNRRRVEELRRLLRGSGLVR